MREFYERYYAAVGKSHAHHVFCERVFGRDLSQHGFADRAQLTLLRQVTHLDPMCRALDVGCGNGRIAEYLSDESGAHVTGLDYIEGAIEQARLRTADKSGRLAFLVGDINHPGLAPGSFDVIVSIDSMYFSADDAVTVCALKRALRPGGRMAFLYSHGREPWVPKDQFRKDTLRPDTTPLARAMQANHLAFRTWNLTHEDYVLARRRKRVLAELRGQFEAEGNLFIHDNRLGDAEGISQAIEDGLHARYLYVATLDSAQLGAA